MTPSSILTKQETIMPRPRKARNLIVLIDQQQGTSWSDRVVEIIDQTDRAIGDITQQVLRARGATIVTVVQADNWQPLPGDESPTP
jgi:hypothetical protein